MLTDKIRLSGPESNEPEDILSSALGVIFPDDITNQHGDRENAVIYLSPGFGGIVLSLADPQGDDNRRLFSHFLWNAGLQLAEFIEEDPTQWSVKGERVLELGAGTGLAGIVACLMGAETVVVSDFPAPEVLGNIEENVVRNVTSRKPGGDTDGGGGERGRGGGGGEDISVQGHEWGKFDDGILCSKEKGTFGRILVADCLWMPWQHANLMKSISWFLAFEGRAWVVAGFHTGREKLRGFYQENLLAENGLEIERIYEKNADGLERAWCEDRGIEDVTERKRWLVVAVLRRRVV